ncbi:hypothetical protein SAMN04488557_1817 [Hyphomicrobium facile]|uniref:Uncharacterized protein n=1 Tax=Hyphomicrobium facile TaxID=51670 RepID=A0A1I7NES1_9HYPH|nr:hypothetical protein SAMN04488557_1817 [Hyphomicrobium facile]
MTAFLKVLVAVTALSAAATTLANASPSDAGMVAGCQADDLTLHGVWDCH